MTGSSLRLPMRIVLLVPLGSVLMASMGLIVMINARNAESYAQQTAIELVKQTGQEVVQYLNGFMRQPVQVVETMADAVESEMVNPDSQPELGRFMALLRQNFPGVPYASYAFKNNSYVGVGLSGISETSPLILETRAAGNHDILNQYLLTANGSQGRLLSRDRLDNFTTEEWFAKPLKLDRTTWTSIYNWADAQDVIVISVGKPIRLRGAIIGVAETDILLSSLSRHLKSLRLSSRSVIYIAEDNGLLVASSTKSLPYDIKAGKGQRRAALMDIDPLIRESATKIIRHFNGFNNIKEPSTLRISLRGQSHLIHVIPWHDPLGLHWIITLFVPESDFTGFVASQRRDTMVLSLAAIILAGLLGWRLVSLLVSPITDLALASSQLASGGKPLDLKDSALMEVQRLSQAFTSMAQRLGDLMQELEMRRLGAEAEVARRTAELAQANQRLRQEEAMAAQIQKELLVPESRLRGLVPDIDLGALMLASRNIGGDLYDCIPLRDELLLFCVGDVSGNGMPAALLMSTCLSLLRSYSEVLDSPSAMMRRINRRLSSHNQTCDFTSLVIGVLNRHSGELRYCNAGHNPMLWYQPGLPTEVIRVVHGPPLGIEADVVYSEARLFLNPQDLLLVYSDGATEMVNDQGQRYGLHRLITSLDMEIESSEYRGASGLVQRLLYNLQRFAGAEPARDDITLLALQRLVGASMDRTSR